MTRSEFLSQLREALQGDLSSSTVQENVNYYNSYISEEVAKGKREEEVLQMLGDPWILAHTIIDANDGTDRETVYESGGGSYTSSRAQNEYGRSNTGSNIHVFGLDTWWKKLLLVLVVIMVVVLIVAVISGVVQLLAPVLVPLLIVMIIVRLIGGSGRRR